MATSEPGRTSTMKPQPGRVQFQDVAEFEAEQFLDNLSDERQHASQPQRKKAKPVIDVEAVVAEQQAVQELGDTNWIGKLLEYRAAHPTTADGLQFVEQVMGGSSIPRFTCKVTISEISHHFGGDNVSFSSKKLSKQYACKKAIDWLIENNFMPANGAVKFPKVATYSSQTSPPTKSSGTSYAAQVPPLCNNLGFGVPRYEIVPVQPGVPVYDVWADFGGDYRIEGKVGEVKGIHGRKNAREECARSVIAFLLDIERQRMAELDEDEKERKRSSESVGRKDGKAVKVEV